MCGIKCLVFALLVTLPCILKAADSKREEPCGGDIDLELMGGVAEIRLRTGEINGVEFYRVFEDCTWTLMTADDHFMILKSDYFSVEKSENCILDYVKITEKGIGGATSRHCGFDPLTYITFGNIIQLQFKSDDSSEYKGFKFTIKSLKKFSDDTFCIGSILSGKDSSILNKETSGDNCFYRIQAPKHNDITLTLKLLNFGSASCEEESIIIYEGYSTQGRPLGTICSDNDLGILPYRASSMFIEYRNPLKLDGGRFEIEYMFVEDNFISSTITSSVKGNDDIGGSFKGNNTENGISLCTESKYKNNKKLAVAVCNDNLPRHVVQIEFDYFDMENSDDCIFDLVNLLLLTGDREETSFLNGQSCGKNKHWQMFVTRGNSLRLELKTDESLALKNFQAKISFVPDTECICKDHMECIQDNTEKCVRGKYCDINRCQNGGTCIKNRSNEKCYCPKGFKGDDCSQRNGEFPQTIRFIKAPVDRTIKRGEGHIEECTVEVPYGGEVEYNWSFQGILLDPYSKQKGFGTHPGGVLQIDDFSNEMEGQYSCVATTSVGTANHTFTYTIAEDCDVRIFPGPQSEIKNINEMALFTCRVDHRAKEVRWKKDGVYINYAKDDRIKKLTNNYLLISNVQLSDAGVYRCEAEDFNGCNSYKEGQLQVVDLKPLKKYCGISIHDEAMVSSRISKGSEALPGMHPWHVTFRTRGGASTKIAFCGGTLISQRYVITAAHCIKQFNPVFGVPFSAENVEFLLGTTDCLGTQNDGIRRTVQSFTVHPDYEKRQVVDNDIAVIELDSLVQYNEYIRPICVQPADYNDRVFLENSGSLSPVIGKVAGCGATRPRGRSMPQRLRDVYIPYVDRETCLASLGGQRHQLTDTMFCAGSNLARTGDSCKMDGGGGLIMATSTRWVLTGIVSWGKACDMDKYYSIYTHVGMFYNWIESVTKFNEEEVQDFFNRE